MPQNKGLRKIVAIFTDLLTIQNNQFRVIWCTIIKKYNLFDFNDLL